MRKLILLNLYAFLFWIATSSLSYFDLAFLKYLQSFSALIATLVLAGLNLTALIQLFNLRQFSKIEILSIASVSALIVPPLLVTLEYSFLKYLSPALPFINSLAIFILFLIFHYKKKTINLKNFDFLDLKTNKNGFLKFIKSPLFLAFIVLFTAIIATFSAFYALPELDPYYWYSNFQEMVSQGAITALSGYRPLFMSLIYILNQSANIDLYAVFKYILPLMTLMILIPAWLVAKNQDNRLKQFVILLIPFINASAFLYSQMPIPQAILNIILYYFLFFLLYSWINKDDLFYSLSGIIISLAYLYHESAILIFLVWFIIAILVYRKNIFTFIKNNQLPSFLIFIIFVSNFSHFFKGPYLFLTSYVKNTFTLETIFKFNFLFPAHYTNVDNNLMGWGDFIGVIKYYAFYVGPAFFSISACFICLWFISGQFKEGTKKELFSKELLTLALSFLCFFSISEILPRLFGVALLPERSWIFGGIFSIVFLFIIFKHQNKNKFISILIIISLIINIGEALYVNNLKKYMITTENLKSAEWIKKNLPEDRAIFSNINPGALELYSQSETVGVSDKFYYDIAAFQESIEKIKIGLATDYNNLVDKMIVNISDLKNYDIRKEKDGIKLLLKKNSAISKRILALLKLSDNKETKNLYIYFSEANKNNPYINRPYYRILSQSEDFIFDKYPDKFKRIYFDEENNIIIWKIL